MAMTRHSLFDGVFVMYPFSDKDFNCFRTADGLMQSMVDNSEIVALG